VWHHERRREGGNLLAVAWDCISGLSREERERAAAGKRSLRDARSIRSKRAPAS
jgi:hypothetical protein